MNDQTTESDNILDDLVERAREAFASGDYDELEQITRQALQTYRTTARPPKWARPKCGAKTRRGTPCQAPAYWPKGEPAPRNGRCRMHGGLSTGPRTPEGKAAIAASNRRRRVCWYGMEYEQADGFQTP